MCVYAVSARHGQNSITKKNVAVLLFKSAANLPLCVGSTVITARRLMKGVVEVFTTRCDGGAAQQGHAVSVGQIPTQHRVGCGVISQCWFWRIWLSLLQAINTCRL